METWPGILLVPNMYLLLHYFILGFKFPFYNKHGFQLLTILILCIQIIHNIMNTARPILLQWHLKMIAVHYEAT